MRQSTFRDGLDPYHTSKAVVELRQYVKTMHGVPGVDHYTVPFFFDADADAHAHMET